MPRHRGFEYVRMAFHPLCVAIVRQRIDGFGEPPHRPTNAARRSRSDAAEDEDDFLPPEWNVRVALHRENKMGGIQIDLLQCPLHLAKGRLIQTVPTKNKVELLKEPPIEKPKKPPIERKTRGYCQKLRDSDGGDHDLAVDLLAGPFRRESALLRLPMAIASSGRCSRGMEEMISERRKNGKAQIHRSFRLLRRRLYGPEKRQTHW